MDDWKKHYYSWQCKHLKKRQKRLEKRYGKYQAKCDARECELIELETESGREKAWQEKYIKSKAYGAIIVGIVMLIMTFGLSYISNTKGFSNEKKALIQSIVTVLNSVFSIIIGIGISTLVLDFFSYIKYTRERIKEIMLDKAYIETLSDKEKKSIIETCEKSLYFKKGDLLDNSLYTNIKELIVPLIEENYYKQYKVHVDCYIDEKKKIITKKVHKIMDIECIEESEKFELPFSTYLTGIPGIEKEQLYQLKECTFNGKDYTEEIKKHIVSSETMNYNQTEDIKFSLNYEFEIRKGLNRIEIRVETKVPLSDNTYSHTITIPCKRYSANFSVHNDNYTVLGFAFAFDDEKHKDNTEKIIYRDKYDDCYKIRFENWTLPGDGVVFLVNPKELDKKENNVIDGQND